MGKCEKCGVPCKKTICNDCAELESMMNDLFDSMATLNAPQSATTSASNDTVRTCICGAEIQVLLRNVAMNNGQLQGSPMILHELPPCQNYIDLDFADYMALLDAREKN